MIGIIVFIVSFLPILECMKLKNLLEFLMMHLKKISFYSDVSMVIFLYEDSL